MLLGTYSFGTGLWRLLFVCHVVVLDGGRIIERGDRAAILGSAAVREAYLGAHAEAA